MLRRSLEERSPGRGTCNAHDADQFPALGTELGGLIDDILLADCTDHLVLPLLVFRPVYVT
jgi:hypothetical protein